MPRTLIIIALATIRCAGLAPAQVATPVITGPPTLEELTAEAERLYEQWRNDEVRALSLRMVTHYPESAESWLWRGRAHAHDEEWEQAQAAYKRALEIDAQMLRARAALVLAMGELSGTAARTGAATDLVEHCGEIIADDPANRDAHFTRSWALHWMGDNTGAVDEVRQVVELFPDDAQGVRDLGGFLTIDQEFDEGAVLLERSLALQPDSMSALFSLTWTYSYLQRFDDARAAAARMKRLNPMDPTAYCRAGWIRGYELGDLPGALQEHDLALALDPTDTRTWEEKAHILRIKGDPADALQVLDEAVEAGIAPEKLYRTRGSVYRSMDRHEDAVAEYTRAIEVDPNDGLAYWLRARAYLALERYEEAWRDLHHAEDLGQPPGPIADQLREHMPEPEREGEG